MSNQWHGGKGSAPRKTNDQKTYEDNWEKIFGKSSHISKDTTRGANKPNTDVDEKEIDKS